MNALCAFMDCASQTSAQTYSAVEPAKLPIPQFRESDPPETMNQF